MAGTIVFCDARIQQRAADQRTFFVNGTTWNLFSNNFAPTVSTLLAGFTFASYAGYSSIAGFTGWSAIYAIAAGQWQFDSGLQSFPAATAGSQVVYGVVLTDYLGNLLLSAAFSAPVTMASGGPPLYVVLSPVTWAAILL